MIILHIRKKKFTRELIHFLLDLSAFKYIFWLEFNMELNSFKKPNHVFSKFKNYSNLGEIDISI